MNRELAGAYLPVGTTDSERAFCVLMEALRSSFDQKPSTTELYEVICSVTAKIREVGSFNFMLSNGELLFVHCSTDLHYIIRQHPFDQAHLQDVDMTIDFAEHTTPNDRVAVIATQPLTHNEVWTRIAPQACLIFKGGALWQEDQS